MEGNEAWCYSGMVGQEGGWVETRWEGPGPVNGTADTALVLY